MRDRNTLRPIKNAARNVTLGVASAIVVLFAVAYVAFPGPVSFALTANDTGTALPKAAAHYQRVSTKGGSDTDARASLWDDTWRLCFPRPWWPFPAGRGHSPAHDSPGHDKSGNSEVVYGKVSVKDGVHVSRVTVALDDRSHGGSDKHAVINVGTAHDYRTTVHLDPGTYQVEVAVVVGKQTHRATKTITIADHHTYDVSIVVRHGGVFSYLPVSSY